LGLDIKGRANLSFNTGRVQREYIFISSREQRDDEDLRLGGRRVKSYISYYWTM